MKQVLKEWYVQAPWGKIAMVSWGNVSGQPVLLVHGRQDSVSTFIPLLEHLPDDYYYVGLDLPGHGRSDKFPNGVLIMRFHFIAALEVAINHLEWTKYIYLSHSMGSEIGLFYNAIHPHQIKKFILLDPGLSLRHLQVPNYLHLNKIYYNDYYSNYDKYNNEARVYSELGAVDAVMKARGFSEGEARLVLQRNMTKVGDDKFRLSWDKRLRVLAPMYLTNKFYIELFSLNTPPTLIIAANGTRLKNETAQKAVDKLISDLKNKSLDFEIIRVDGGHDVHVTNPERFAREIIDFMSKRCADIKSKL